MFDRSIFGARNGANKEIDRALAAVDEPDPESPIAALLAAHRCTVNAIVELHSTRRTLVAGEDADEDLYGMVEDLAGAVADLGSVVQVITDKLGMNGAAPAAEEPVDDKT